jgi:chromosome segregation ATPase
MSSDYKELLTKDLKSQEVIKEQTSKISQLEKRKENQKDYVFLMRQEVKSLKKEIKEMQAEKENMYGDTDRSELDHQVKKKTMVLKDIQNLIKDYKHERGSIGGKINQTDGSCDVSLPSKIDKSQCQINE